MSEEPYSHSIDGMQKNLPRKTVELELNTHFNTVSQKLCKKCGEVLNNPYRVRRVEWELKEEILYHRIHGETFCSNCLNIHKIILEDKY